MGIASIRGDLPEDTSQEELLAVVRELNEDPACTGYIVQLPLPKHIDQTSSWRPWTPTRTPTACTR